VGAGRDLFAPGAVAGACPGPHIRPEYAPARTTPRLPPHPSKIPPAGERRYSVHLQGVSNAIALGIEACRLKQRVSPMSVRFTAVLGVSR
jgi:hypothetical protein